MPSAHPKPNKSQVRKMRQFVYRRDNWTCQKCGKSMKPEDEASYNFNYAPYESGIYLEMDHIIPRSKGGPYTPANLVSACTPCNVKKNVSFCDATWQQRIDYAIAILQSGAGDETTALRAIEALSSTIK